MKLSAAEARAIQAAITRDGKLSRDLRDAFGYMGYGGND